MGVLGMQPTNSTGLRAFLGHLLIPPAVLLAGMVALSGCAESHKAAGPSTSPRRVAAEFAMFYAKIAANEDEPASEAQVRALARALAPTCSAPRDGQYPCVVHVPGRIPTTQRCVAVVGSSGQVTGRCSAGAALAPVVATGFVNCATVGHVLSISDPAGDEKRVVPLLRSDQLVPASEPRADLMQVRVAATPTRFCADFRTSAPPRQGSCFGVNIWQNGAPDLLFAPVINYRNSPTPELQSPVNSPVAGQIGTSGDWTSLFIAAGDPAAPLPHGSFQFRAYANYETFTPGTVRLTTDSAPDSARRASYP